VCQYKRDSGLWTGATLLKNAFAFNHYAHQYFILVKSLELKFLLWHYMLDSNGAG